jgi:predicted ATPase/DNA-binding CsgD family transcriptional regulator
LAEIGELLNDPACRLLALVGPGGIGKTRLAVQAAVDVTGDPGLAASTSPAAQGNASFQDGAYFVPLQSVQSAHFLVPAVADAIAFPLAGQNEPVVQLLSYLHDKHMLLLLDNFEHLLTHPQDGGGNDFGSRDGIPGASKASASTGMHTETVSALDLLSDILLAAPGVKLLVTTREVLNLQEEWIYQVQGLPYPEAPLREDEPDLPPVDAVPAGAGEDEPIPAGDWEDLEAYGAIQLFVERARRVRRDFSPADEAAALVRICQLVEGMPLAIELAAAWTKTIPCSVIAEEIQRNIDFLSSSLRNVPERQRSMRAIFDQSWHMLGQQERSVFKRLSVFHGSFDREAAARIAGASLATLSALGDKSLLRPESNGRYQIHELLRQYAALQLAQSPEAIANVYDLHCAYYAEFLREREADMAGARQLEAVAEIKAELSNIRAAWEWAVGLYKAQEINHAVQTLSWFYQYQSRYLEAAAALEKAVHSLKHEEGRTEADLALAAVLVHLGWFYIRLGRLEQAEAVVEESRLIYRRLDVPPVPGQASNPLLPLAIIASIRGDYEAAARLGEETRQMSEAQDQIGNLPFALYALARACLGKGDLEAARRHAERAYAIVERIHDRWFMAYCLNELGNIASALRNYEEAEQHYRTSYAIRQAFDDPEGMAVALNHLGKIATRQEHYEEAEQLFRQSLAIYQRINDRGGLATSLNGLGATGCALGDHQTACQHFRRALEVAMDVQFMPLVLSIVSGIAESFIKTGRAERGVELLALVRGHPASERETRDMADECLERYRPALASEVFAAAVERGQDEPLASVVAALQSELTAPEVILPVPSHGDSRRTRAPEQPLIEPLTSRELEVLELIANGLTNQQIADELILSVGTVKFYTSQIYGKLGVSSRTQAVARARALDMVV